MKYKFKPFILMLFLVVLSLIYLKSFIFNKSVTG